MAVADPLQPIIDTVAEIFGLSRNDLVARNKEARINWPRHVAIYFCRERLNVSYEAIGEGFGGRDHGTIINSIKQVENRIATEEFARGQVQQIRDELNRRLNHDPKIGSKL